MKKHCIAILGDGVTARQVRQYAEKHGVPIGPVEEADLIITSPGIDPKNFPQTKTPIISEIEWAYRLYQEGGNAPKIIAVTGTNGKSTVTSMIAQCCDIPYAGNIGIPLINYVGLENEFPEIVVEVSSYQCETLVSFKPDIAVMLNITPDHLGRHKTVTEYKKQKEKCWINQTPEDWIVYPKNDDEVEAMIEESLAQPVAFTMDDLDPEFLDKSHLLGTHNYQNAAAAVAVSRCMGISPMMAQTRLMNFKGLKHRLECIGEVNQRYFYNDSKATNPDAVIKALDALNQKPWIILCGEDKQLEYQSFIHQVIQKTAGIITCGDCATNVQTHVENINPLHPFKRCQNLKEATENAIKQSRPGDSILLSPSSSSLDQFDSFEQRGNRFVEYIAEYAEKILV